MRPTLPHLEQEILLCHAYGINRAELYAHPTRYNDQATSYKQFIERRQKHEPIAYLTGYQPFLGLDILVNREVLIPRPETEYMAEIAIEKFKNQISIIKIADIGTGSGCIAVALAKYMPKAVVYAIDSNELALKVARANAEKHGVAKRMEFLKGHLLDPLKEKVDLIISNPPYIPTSDLDTLMPDVRDYEPVSALDGGPDGLKYIREILEISSSHLIPRTSYLIIEIGFGQSEEVRKLALEHFEEVEIQNDLAGIPRYLIATNN